MLGIARQLTASAIALSLIAVPTGAVASAPASSPPPTAQQAAAATSTNPWLTLSAMTTTSSSAATAAAAQGDEGPGFPPILPLVVILGTIALAVWILASDDDDSGIDFEEPISP